MKFENEPVQVQFIAVRYRFSRIYLLQLPAQEKCSLTLTYLMYMAQRMIRCHLEKQFICSRLLSEEWIFRIRTDMIAETDTGISVQ